MYAITFFSLLNEAYRIKDSHLADLLSVNSPTPDFLTKLTWSLKDADDILNTEVDPDEDIKGKLSKII